ncbi:hypothetical protein L9F63_014908, partial [Diploptera punctata]
TELYIDKLLFKYVLEVGLSNFQDTLLFYMTKEYYFKLKSIISYIQNTTGVKQIYSNIDMQCPNFNYLKINLAKKVEDMSFSLNTIYSINIGTLFRNILNKTWFSNYSCYKANPSESVVRRYNFLNYPEIYPASLSGTVITLIKFMHV